MEILISLELIDPNPWQQRQREDPEHVAQIAASIAQNGLLQSPGGRMVTMLGEPCTSLSQPEISHLLATGARVQLAFGHTRLAAFVLLNKIARSLLYQQPLGIDFAEDSPMADAAVAVDRSLNEDKTRTWDHIPVNLIFLNDEDMFRQGIAENEGRRDLSPIERAHAMRVYRDKFKKSSAEIGQLFGLSESAVRNLMRLEDLPETTRNLVDVGALGENTARKLLSVEKVKPGLADSISKYLADNGITSTSKINETIERQLRERGLRMWSSNGYYPDKEPTGGPGLWPLDWVTEAQPAPKLSNFEKLYTGPKEIEIGYPSIQPGVPDTPTHYDLSGFYKHLVLFVEAEMEKRSTGTVQVRIAETAPEALALLRQLMHPPACKICPFHIRMDGAHWCMLEACHKIKKVAWIQAEMVRESERLGIPIYDRDKDGPCEELTGYYSGGGENKAKQWFDERADHLRIKARYNEYGNNYLIDSKIAGLVSVRPEIAEKKEAETEYARKVKTQQDYEAVCRQATIQFLKEQVYPSMKAQLLAHFKHAGAVQFLSDSWAVRNMHFDNPIDPDTVDQVKETLLADRLQYKISVSKGPVYVAKQLQQLLGDWDVHISGDLVAAARSYEPVSVSAETVDQPE